MASSAQAVANWIGASASSEHDLATIVEHRLPTDTVTRLTEHGLTREEIHRLVIPLRTWKHRRSRQEPLSAEESDRAVRAARVLALAESVFGTREKALGWMRQPKRRFHDRTPMDMLATEAGGRLVDQMLIQIDEGMFA